MLVVQIKRDVLEKSRNGGKLVPVKKTVTRGGKAFQMTFWVDPDDKKAEVAPQGSLFDIEEVEAKHVGSRPVKNGDKVPIDGKYFIVKVRNGFVYLEDDKGTVEWGTQAGKELPTAVQIAASVQEGRNKNIFGNIDEPAAAEKKKMTQREHLANVTADDLNREVTAKRAKDNEVQVRARGTKIERKEPGSTKWEFMAETSTPEIAASLVEKMNSGDNGINDQAKQAADLLADHGLIIRKGSQISYSKVSDMVKELDAAGKIPDSMKEELAREYVGSRIKSIEAFKRRAGHGNHTDNAAKKGMMDDIKNGNYDKYVSTAFASSMQGFLQQTDTRLPYHPEDYSHEIKSWANLANSVASLVIDYLHDKKDESAETHRISKSIGPVGMFVQGWLRGKR
jgi:hypothetical protein